jgi:hypothetical protein
MPTPNEQSLSLGYKPSIPLRKLGQKLSGMGFSALRVSDSAITLVLSHSPTSHGIPDSYTKLVLSPTHIKLSYTQDGDIALRRLEACLILLEVFSLAGSGAWASEELLSFLRTSIAEASERLSEDTRSILAKHSLLLEENRKLAEQLSHARSQYDKAEAALADAKKQAEAAEANLHAANSISDEALCEQLFDHLRSHSGAINLPEFSSRHNISVARAEHGLELLCKEGYVERKK